MKRGAPWYKRYPDDYINGTRRLSLEARGAYSDILDLIYMNDGSIPDDAKWISHALCVSTRKWRAVRKELLAAKKIQILDSNISNIRARDELEIRRSQADNNREIAVNRERTKREKSKKTNENNKREARNTHHARAIDTDTDTEIDKSAVGAGKNQPQNCAANPDELTALSDRLLAACNGALDNPANCMGLLAVTEPRMWIEQGCDLERDIIPTLVAAGKRHHGKRIRSWGYFTGMVIEARDRRMRGVPASPASPDVAAKKPLLPSEIYKQRQAAKEAAKQ